MTIAKRLNLIVIATRAFVLPTNDLLDIGRQVFFERLAITVNGDIFTALALIQHCLVVVESQRPTNREPAAMRRT